MNAEISNSTVRTELVEVQSDIFSNVASRSVRRGVALPFDRLRANGTFMDSVANQSWRWRIKFAAGLAAAMIQPNSLELCPYDQ